MHRQQLRLSCRRHKRGEEIDIVRAVAVRTPGRLRTKGLSANPGPDGSRSTSAGRPRSSSLPARRLKIIGGRQPAHRRRGAPSGRLRCARCMERRHGRVTGSWARLRESLLEPAGAAAQAHSSVPQPSRVSASRSAIRVQAPGWSDSRCHATFGVSKPPIDDRTTRETHVPRRTYETIKRAI